MIIDKDDTINMGELSKQNGKSEIENFKTILQILEVKAGVYDIPQKVIVSFKEVQNASK